MFSLSLTHWALLVGEKDATVAAVCVGHADVVPICPIEFPAGDKSKHGQQDPTSHLSDQCININVLSCSQVYINPALTFQCLSIQKLMNARRD